MAASDYPDIRHRIYRHEGPPTSYIRNPEIPDYNPHLFEFDRRERAAILLENQANSLSREAAIGSRLIAAGYERINYVILEA